MKQTFNFSTNQSSVPYDVTQELIKRIYPPDGEEASAFELDFASDECKALFAHAEDTLRELLHIPANYRVLFMAGGEEGQFSAVPMNLLSEHKIADYIITGIRSKDAYLEGKKYGDMNIAASSAGANPPYSSVPDVDRSIIRPDADYVHVCYNNPVCGTAFHTVPDTGTVPLVADMTTSFLSEPIDVSAFGLIYAASGQNFGISGLTVVIVREDLLGGAIPETPSVLNYEIALEKNPAFCAPNLFALTVADAVFTWILKNGGLDEMKRRSENKVSILYDYLDSQIYYTAIVDRKYRSLTNVVFVTGNADMDERFIEAAEAEGITGLHGHPSIGGIRASLYNSMSCEGVEALVAFMKKFAMQNPKLEI